MRQFKIGDEVTWCGMEGIVVDVTKEKDEEIVVYLGKSHGIKFFTEEGKSKAYYKVASLKLKEDNKE